MNRVNWLQQFGFVEQPQPPRSIAFTAALFDDPKQLPPTYAIHARSKPEWLRLDEHLPHHAEGQALEPE